MMSRRLPLSKGITYVVVTVTALILVYPLLWMLSSSFKPESLIFREMGIWPTGFTLENYKYGWRGVAGVTFTTFYLNTFFIVGLAIIGNVLTCSMAAYAFSRIDFTLKKTLFAAMLVTIMLPYHVVLIPQYMIFHQLGWVNTYLPLTVPKFLASDAFFIFLMVQFIRTLPQELDQAAIVDGCNPVQIYTKIILPLLTPAVVTTTIFTFIWTWNDFFSQLIYISSPRLFTVSLGLRMFLDSEGTSNWGAMFAMSMVSLLPVLLFFVFFQRLIIDGIATSGLKG
ncbi:carbohydrate ABC transporter permease [Paenibacillus senegalensis]|uniref:carbohydrate ABC transporter permease n=1 Tax=Paenibacillus senegalensis TaxID=1465766 RepID=UPI0002899105